MASALTAPGEGERAGSFSRVAGFLRYRALFRPRRAATFGECFRLVRGGGLFMEE